MIYNVSFSYATTARGEKMLRDNLTAEEWMDLYLEKEVTVIRNLNAAKRDFTVFKWSVAFCNGNSRGKTIANVDTLNLRNIRVGFSAYKYRTTQEGTNPKRAVYIWLIGEIVNEPIKGTLQRFSCNPKRGESDFRFGDGSLVDFTKVKGVRLNSSGAYAIN